MVNAKQATESMFVTAKLINDSKSKTLVIMPGGKYEEGKFGVKLQLNVSLDAKAKKWNPNTESAHNLAEEWGFETDDWVGKRAFCELKEKSGKEIIIATPIDKVAKVVEEKVVDNSTPSPAPVQKPAVKARMTDEEILADIRAKEAAELKIKSESAELNKESEKIVEEIINKREGSEQSE